jgi:hypothetical protein
LVEGSSPSPVTETKITENSQKALRNEGFLMRTRSEVQSADQCTELHGNELESNSRATAGATWNAELISSEIPDDLRCVVDAWGEPKPLSPDSLTLGLFIEILEKLEDNTEWCRKNTETAVQSVPPELAMDVLFRMNSGIEKCKTEMLARFGTWPEQFQGIADRDYGGAKLDSRILRSIREKILQAHPEMTTQDVSELHARNLRRRLAKNPPPKSA